MALHVRLFIPVFLLRPRRQSPLVYLRILLKELVPPAPIPSLSFSKILTHRLLVDDHAAVLIKRLIDLTKVELMPSELLHYGLVVFDSDLWKRVMKGNDTMEWSGQPTLQSTMTAPDEDSKPDVKGKGRAE